MARTVNHKTLKTPTRVVELFCGIGGFRLAAEERALTTVWANDSSSEACAVYRDRFGEKGLHEGDIRDLVDQVPAHDLLTAGFPCQPFSSAGKKRGTGDLRGTLFECIAEVLRRQQPEHFVLENVPGLLSMSQGDHFREILTTLVSAGYNIEWRLINAMDLGLPQCRRRILLVGARRDGVTALEVDQARLANRSEMSLTSQWARGAIAAHRGSVPPWGMAAERHFVAGNVPMVPRLASPRPLRDLLEPTVGSEFDFTATTKRRIASSSRVERFVDGVQVLFNQEGGRRMGYTVFGVDGVAPTLTATSSRHYERYAVGNRFRRLTDVEYARLQGFADDHCRSVGRGRRYVLLGNAIPPILAGYGIDAVMSASIRSRATGEPRVQLA